MIKGIFLTKARLLVLSIFLAWYVITFAKFISLYLSIFRFFQFKFPLLWASVQGIYIIYSMKGNERAKINTENVETTENTEKGETIYE